MGNNQFDDIRPLHDGEVSETIQTLIENADFRKSVESVISPFTWEQLTAALLACKSVYDFQSTIIYPVVRQLINKTTTEFKCLGMEKIKEGQSYAFISNHRDIVLDAGFLNIMFFEARKNTSEIAIGDNLLAAPWITDLVRLNKSFIVKRGVSVREMLATSKHLSEYIFDTLHNRKQSIWIAQREGRAKDSNDRTQTSLLKMLTLYNAANPVEALKALNIIPLALSYEFDPCDFLKAKEFQLKRDNPEHKKTKADDVESMATGIRGYKGRVNFQFGNPVNRQLTAMEAELPRTEILEKTAQIIDTEIFRNYVFYPLNYVAYDWMSGEKRFAGEYSNQDKLDFEKYVEKQIAKIDIPNKDEDFLRSKIIAMYGNPVKNHLSAL